MEDNVLRRKVSMDNGNGNPKDQHEIIWDEILNKKNEVDQTICGLDDKLNLVLAK